MERAHARLALQAPQHALLGHALGQPAEDPRREDAAAAPAAARPAPPPSSGAVRVPARPRRAPRERVVEPSPDAARRRSPRDARVFAGGLAVEHVPVGARRHQVDVHRRYDNTRYHGSCGRVDNITHSLFALTLANAGLRRAGRGSTAALLIASNIPDIEVLTAFTGRARRATWPTTADRRTGRSASASRWRRPPPSGSRCGCGGAENGRRRFLALLAVSTIGFLGHIALDLATSYGTRVLSPFRDTWYGVDWMPIVDVYLLVILAAGLAAGLMRPAWRARAAAAALSLMAGDYALHAGAHAVALRDAVSLQEAALPGSVGRLGLAFHYLDGERPGGPAGRAADARSRRSRGGSCSGRRRDSASRRSICSARRSPDRRHHLPRRPWRRGGARGDGAAGADVPRLLALPRRRGDPALERRRDRALVRHAVRPSARTNPATSGATPARSASG